MKKMRKALVGNTITIISGPYDGYRGVALEDAGEKNFLKVRIIDGKYKNSTVRIAAGEYILGPN